MLTEAEEVQAGLFGDVHRFERVADGLRRGRLAVRAAGGVAEGVDAELEVHLCCSWVGVMRRGDDATVIGAVIATFGWRPGGVRRCAAWPGASGRAGERRGRR